MRLPWKVASPPPDEELPGRVTHEERDELEEARRQLDEGRAEVACRWPVIGDLTLYFGGQNQRNHYVERVRALRRALRT